MPVCANLELWSGLFQLFGDAVFTGFDNDDPLRFVTADGSLEFFEKASLVGFVVKLTVIYREAPAAQFIAKVPHGGKKDCDAGLVIPDVHGLRMHFRHPDDIAGPVEAVEGRTGQIKLISKDENKIHILRDAMTAATALIVEHVRETGRRHAYSDVVTTN